MIEVDSELIFKKNQLSSRFKQVFHNTGFGIMIVDKNRDLIEVNPKFCDMLGYNKEELIGQNAEILHISNKSYKEFGEKVYRIRENVRRNIKKLEKNNSLIIGYGAPAKATTALNFFGISKEIDFIVEGNKLKHNKFIPGVKIPIKNKLQIKDKKNTLIVLAWNFYKDIKKKQL